MRTTPLSQLPVPRRRAALWAIGTAAGTVAGAIACQLLLGEYPTGAGFVLLLPVLMGAAIGGGQWLALREEAPLPVWWPAASALGWLPAPFFYVQRAATIPSYDPYGAGAPPPWMPDFRWPEIAVPSVAAFAGIGVGLLQAFLLPRVARSRTAWAAAAAAGYFAGGVVALLLGPTLLAVFLDLRSSLWGSPVRDVLEALFRLARPLWYGGCVGIVAGLVTALPIARTPEAPPEAPSVTPPAPAPAPSAGPEPAPAPPAPPPSEPAEPEAPRAAA